MRLSDALVTALKDWGVRYVFGVSGANVEDIHDSIHRIGDGRLSSILARREDGAAFMADSRARVHKTLGVCCSTSGGAMMNLAVGLAESYAESVPVLALVGQPPRNLEGRGAFQDSSGIGRAIDAVGLFRCMSKFTQQIDAGRFWEQLQTAVTSALSGRQGPAVLLLPRDAYSQDVGERPSDWPDELAALVQTPRLDEAQVTELFQAMRSAKQPTLLLGQGVRRSSNARAVVDFARASGIAVATTMSARADFPNDDPLYLGVVGVAGHPSAHEFIRRRTDLLVVAGAGFNMMTRQPIEMFAAENIAAVNVDCGEIDRAVGPPRKVTADVGEVFEMLGDMLRADPFKAPPINGYQLLRYQPRLAAAIGRRAADARSGTDDLLQSEAIAALSTRLPSDGHIVLDAGNCASAVMHLSFVPTGASSTIALGAGGMGYGVAAAIGAQLGSPSGTRTMAFCGDGGVLCNGLEMHVAVDLGLPVLFVVFNNQMHGMCAIRQQLFFGERIEASTYAPVDIAQMARGFGPPESLWVASAGTLAELHYHIDEYYGRFAHLPGMLELRLRHEEMPPFSPFLRSDEPTF